ncbi:hypothetical protein SAMN05428954_4067 [Streptomyces sp. 2112.3]|nr:hypothetical protein SAMN05428954_4067 [Streptomyces sp. 2112.3]
MAGNTVDLGIMGCTDFEKSSHQALYDMVADADHLHIIVMGTDLVDAGKEIARITHDLEAYARQTQAHWKGEGAQAFDDWTRETATESRKLGHYAKTTGEAMVDAATALGQAKLMPKPPQLRNFVETDTAKPNGVTALAKDPGREDAIAEMTRLASYYRTAQQKIAGQEAPNFRPASGFVPEPQDAGQSLDPATDGRPTAATDVGSTAPAPGHDSGAPHTETSRPTADGAEHERQVGTSVDSTAPATSHQATPHREGAPPAQPPSGTTGPLPGPAPSGPVSRRGPVTVPDRPGKAANRSEPTADRRTATGEGINSGTARRGSTTVRRPQLPAGTVVGEEPGMPPRRPAGSGRTGKGMAQEGALHSGQRLVPPYGEPVDRSRAPVMGAERGSLARGLAGGGHSGNMGRGTGQNVPSVPGRRMAYEPGGTVGTERGGVVAGEEHRSGTYGSTNGRNSASGVTQGPAAARSSMAEPGRAGGRAPTSTGRASDFTSGGSGLARGTATPSSGMLPVSGSPSARRRSGASGARPGYLQEDGETWTAQHPSVVPPVIE